MTGFSAYFNPDSPYFEFAIDDNGPGLGPTVYSECCADYMTREVAIQVRDALTEWIEQTA